MTRFVGLRVVGLGCYVPPVLGTGVYAASAGLLAVAGAQKAVDPQPLVRALRSMRLPASKPVVRAGAVAELALGGTALLTGSRPVALLVGLSYAAFTAVVLLALRRGGVLASCGCFGKRDVPPTPAHAAVTAGFALVALTAPGTVGLDVPLVLAAAATAAAAWAVMAVLPLVQVR